MGATAEDNLNRTDRILHGKLKVLYQGIFAVPANLGIACAVTFLLRNSYPHELLGAWLATTATVAGVAFCCTGAISWQ